MVRYPMFTAPFRPFGNSMVFHRIVVDEHAPAEAFLAFGGEGFQQTGAQAFAGDLHQAQGGDLGNLVAGAVPTQGFREPAKHQVLVFRQHHVDEVHDDHAAQVAEPHLAHDFFRGLQVVFSDGFFQVAARAGEFPGVHVDYRHGLGAVDDEGAAGGEPYFSAEGFL